MAGEASDGFDTLVTKQRLYEFTIQKFPENVKVIDAYSDYLINKGQLNKAVVLIKKSIDLEPEVNGHKYLNYAETLSGQDALETYKKGIEILLDEQISNEESKENNSDQRASKSSIIASALSSIAELYMTPPLCDEQEAESSCEQALIKALEYDSSNIDAMQCMANLRIMRAKDDEANEYLEKVVLIIWHKDEQNDYNTMPPYEFRMQTARLLIELQNYKKAIKPLDTWIKEDDSNGEAWYLLGFWQFNLKKYQNALECTSNALECDNQEIQWAAKELTDKIKDEIGVGDTSVSEEMNNEGKYFCKIKLELYF